MNENARLCSIVVCTLRVARAPSARDLFNTIRAEQPGVVRKGFKSFVKVVNTLEVVERVTIIKGQPAIYRIREC